MVSPGTSADLQQHLYASLLQGSTADVALRIRGSWEAVYKLHRVVLIQAGFFRSLFTAGFSESVHRFSTHRLGPDQVEIVFDDPNITRAAFEICIARLYGGGPTLHISPSLIPTSSQPLTPSFPTAAPRVETPAGHHPASPRFLLSLLATAVYLSVPSVAGQALTAIMGSVGPHTVVRYLDFAIGRGIGDADEEEPEAAVGLEEIAHPVDRRPAPVKVEEDDAGGLAREVAKMEIQKEDPSDARSVASGDSGASDDSENDLAFDYGAVSTKIGEAAACWLARWAKDIIALERTADDPTLPVTPRPVFPRRRSTTLPSQTSYPAPAIRSVPRIWRRGGLNAKWTAAILSSDALFVVSEKDRYELAKDAVELRRREGIKEAEEREWTELFAHGIYYANMTMDQLILISQDVSPSTRRPYVPQEVIQAAHWNQSLLRHQIVARNSSGSSSPAPREKELGIPLTTADILTKLSPEKSNVERERETLYYAVVGDSSQRIGDSTGLEGASMDQLFDPPSQPSDSKKAVPAVTSETNFFGLKPERTTAAACVAADSSGKSRWSPYPPFRFGVEFWDVDALKEKNRLHSHTVFYAGSLFNVYVQVVRKKGVQLGVYLHRQSTVDPIPPASAPCVAAHASSRPATSDGDPRTHNRAGSLPPGLNPATSMPVLPLPMRSTTPVSSPTRGQFAVAGTPTGTRSHFAAMGTPTAQTHAHAPAPHTIPATAPAALPAQPYRDPRPSVSAYFTISCASTTGGSLTRFTSSPDVFSVSQSWGWKSSSLRTEEYLEVGEIPAPARREVSLRATVVLGVV